MAKKRGSQIEQLGSWAFIIGIVIAIIAGFMGRLNPAMTTILVVLGLIVGLLNVTEREATTFLVAAIALGASSLAVDPLGAIPTVGGILVAVISNIATFIAPAAVVVAVKSIYDLARD